jgi:hypothetical protein
MCFKTVWSKDFNGSVMELVSVESAISYYRDKVRMEGIRWVTISPHEEGYAFRFSESQAIEFLKRIETKYGEPIELGE